MNALMLFLAHGLCGAPAPLPREAKAPRVEFVGHWQLSWPYWTGAGDEFVPMAGTVTYKADGTYECRWNGCFYEGRWSLTWDAGGEVLTWRNDRLDGAGHRATYQARLYEGRMSGEVGGVRFGYALLPARAD